MKLKKNVIFSLILLLAVALICSVGFNGKFITTSAKPSYQQVVLIDAGHGALTNTIDYKIYI